MPVPASINDLSTTAGSNSPAGSEGPQEGDNYIRALSSFIAVLRDQLNGTSTTGVINDGSFSGTMTGFASWSSLQSFQGGITVGNSAQASALTLDWYEEGTFTPGLTFGGGSTGMAGTFLGRFTRIGNRVTAVISIALTAKGTSIGSALVTSLPYAVANVTARAGPSIVDAGNMTVVADHIYAALPVAGFSTVAIGSIDTGTFGFFAQNHNAFTDTSDLLFQVSYEV